MLPIACRPSSLPGWLLAAVLAWTPALAAEPYRLQPGDTIDFALLGSPRLERRIVIGQDGRISIPLGGSFPAAGRTVEELRQAVAELLKTVSYPAGIDTQGSTIWSVIYPEGVLVEMGEYRPIYVSGDVLTPSAQPFSPGTSVAQAVAVAGGASLFRSRQDHSMSRAELGEEEAAAHAAAFRSGLQIERIEAELAAKAEPDFSRVASDGIDPVLARSLRALELETFTVRREDLRKSRENFATNIAMSEARLESLKASQRNLDGEARSYDEEVKRLEALLRKGLIQVDRLTTAQRGMFLVSTRSLDTSATVAKAESDLVDLRRELARVDDAARIENIAALQTASADAAQAAARIEGLRLKARLVQGVGKTADAVRYFVTRREGEIAARSEVYGDSTLQPGDLLEVVLADPSSGTVAAVAQGVPLLTPTASSGAGATNASTAGDPSQRSR